MYMRPLVGYTSRKRVPRMKFGSMLPFKREVGELLDADCLLLSELHFLGTLRVCHMRLIECASGRVLEAGRVKL